MGNDAIAAMDLAGVLKRFAPGESMHTLRAICNGKRFVIPANQRGFSWGAKQVQDLIQDLVLAHAQTHYMGPIIVSRTNTPDFSDLNLENIAEFTLEDGQQRLTTLFIFLNELLRRITELDEEQAYLIDAENLRRLVYYRQDTHIPRLFNQSAALDHYFRFILGLPGLQPPAVRTPPMRALDNVRDKVREFLEPQPLEELRAWAARLQERAQLIWVDLAQHNINRYLAFDAINSRGLPLSDFDKIKNFCILIDSERSLDLQADSRWYDAIAHLESFGVSSRSYEDAFISELYSAFHGRVVTRDKVHSDFVDRYRALLTGPNDLLGNELRLFVAFWAPYAESFGFISTGSRTPHYGHLCSFEAGKWLDRLDNMDLLTITRPLLASSHLRLPTDQFAAVVRACEIYTFRMFAVQRLRKDKNSAEIMRAANQTLRGDADGAYLHRQICIWLGQYAPLRRMIMRLADGEPKYAYDSRINGWGHCYYFLYEYEVGHAPAGVGPLPWARSKAHKVNTQEHILPQGHRDGAWWEAHWPDADQAERFKHRLGNLVLTADNHALGRKPIAEKIADAGGGYSFTSPNSTNTERLVPQYTDGQTWQAEQILLRERAMLEFAARRWSVPCCSDNGLITLPEDFNVSGAPATIDILFEECVEEQNTEEEAEEDQDPADDALDEQEREEEEEEDEEEG